MPSSPATSPRCTAAPPTSVPSATRWSRPHELALGSTITSGDVTTRRVHASQLPDGVLTDDALALGRVVRVPVVRDAYISARNLAASRRTGLDGIIPDGSRAMRVLVEDGLRPTPR